MNDAADSPQGIAIAVVERRAVSSRGGERVTQYLIRQRPAGAPLAGFWEFPGGKVRLGETPAAAAVRECREETGLATRVVEELAVVDHAYVHGSLRLTFYRCACEDAAAPPSGGFHWADGRALRDYEFPPANERVLRMLVEEVSR